MDYIVFIVILFALYILFSIRTSVISISEEISSSKPIEWDKLDSLSNEVYDLVSINEENDKEIDRLLKENKSLREDLNSLESDLSTKDMDDVRKDMDAVSKDMDTNTIKEVKVSSYDDIDWFDLYSMSIDDLRNACFKGDITLLELLSFIDEGVFVFSNGHDLGSKSFIQRENIFISNSNVFIVETDNLVYVNDNDFIGVVVNG